MPLKMKRTIDEISEKSKHCSTDGSGDPNAGDASYSLKVSDVDKLMFITYRKELLHMCTLEHEYDWCWVSHAYRMTKVTKPSADPDEELTIPFIFQEDWERSRYIDRLLARNRLDDAFECAIRSSLFFFMHCRIYFY